MFFTNMAATKVITITKMGFVSGTVLRGGGSAGAEAVLDFLITEEIDYERLARNLVINMGVDFAIGTVSGDAWGDG